MEVKIIQGNKSVLGAFHRKVKKLRVAAYCRVSTDDEDQIKSYNSMIKYYTDLIQKNEEWEFVGIYADKAITGTSVRSREDFQRLIEDCMDGKIDMIITKSIPRFARNTLDTLRYVRLLRENNVAIYFEVEKINTLVDGEFLMTILSSVAQQEVENTSAYVKKGLKMKMKRGELVGFSRCFGYDRDKETGELKIVEAEAETVRHIFDRYLQGAGGTVIARELNEEGILTYNNCKWTCSTILNIIKNEKYMGDMLQGKTYTVDPISKRRLQNNGEEDKFYVEGHHEAIISREVFEKAQELRISRNLKRAKVSTESNRVIIRRQYAFSCILQCYFCGSNLSRRTWHSSSKYSKVIWQCVKSAKKGKRFCPESKAIPEMVIEKAFVESYKILCENNQDILEDLLDKIEVILKDEKIEKEVKQIEGRIKRTKTKRNKLADGYLDGIIPKDVYEKKEEILKSALLKDCNELQYLKKELDGKDTLSDRINNFRNTLKNNQILEEFDRYVFESIIKKVIIGGIDKDGNKDPYMITFIYKTGLEHEIEDAKKKCDQVRNEKEKNADVHSFGENETDSVHSLSGNDTYREYGVATKGQYLKILEFKRFVKHFSFKKISETYSQKELLEEITVVVALDVVERDTRNPSFINESKLSDR